MKKIFKKCILLIAVLLLVNGLRLELMEQVNKNIDFDDINDVVHAGEFTQGDYVIYRERNSIVEAPFMLGERLYLYSIKDDKKYMLKNTFIQEFSQRKIAIQSGDVFYEGDYWDGSPTGIVENININKKNKEISFDFTEYCYAVTNDHLYTIAPIWPEGGGYHEEIISIDRKTGNKVTLFECKDPLETYPYEFFQVRGDNIFVYDENESVIIEKNLNTGEEKEYSFNDKDIPEYIDITDNTHFISIGIVSGNVIRYDSESSKQQLIGNVFIESKDVEERKHRVRNDTGKIKGNWIYSYDRIGNIVRINYETGKKQLVINSEEFFPIEASDNERTFDAIYVGFCSNYIVLIGGYDDIYSHKMIIFDYNGNFVREKEIY